MNPHPLQQLAHTPSGENETAGGENDRSRNLPPARGVITATARETAARIKSATSQATSRAKREAQKIAAEAKGTTASRLDGYSSAMHESAQAFEPQDPNIAWTTHRVANRIQGVADYVRHSGLDDLRMDVEGFARRHPLAFFGGLFGGGLILGHLLKAKPPSADEADDFPPDLETNPSEGRGEIPGSAAAAGI